MNDWLTIAKILATFERKNSQRASLTKTSQLFRKFLKLAGILHINACFFSKFEWLLRNKNLDTRARNHSHSQAHNVLKIKTRIWWYVV